MKRSGMDPKETALIIIDMQNDFCHENGACGVGGMVDIAAFQACAAPIAKLAERARAVGIPVLFVKMTLDASTTSDAWKFKHSGSGPFSIVVKNSWGADYYGDLVPEEGDYIIEKHRYSAFIGTNLNLTLRSLNRKSIVLAGVLTNVCVESTARDGFMLDYNVTLASDCCAGSSPEAHSMTLSNIGNYFGQVVESQQILEQWSVETTAVSA